MFKTSPAKSEFVTRKELVDRKLKDAGWKIVRFDPSKLLAAYERCAIEEYPTENGPADYALCAGRKIVGVVSLGDLATRRVVLWSTSRNKIWRKGETSGDYLDLVDVRVNCEQNSLLVLCRPVQRGCCHTKDAAGKTRVTCYYRQVLPNGERVKLAPIDGKF